MLEPRTALTSLPRVLTPRPRKQARKTPVALPAPAGPDRSPKRFVVLRFRDSEGRTSVCIPIGQMLALQQRLDDDAQLAVRHARELALAAPRDSGNRSGWVQAQLARWLKGPAD